MAAAKTTAHQTIGEALLGITAGIGAISKDRKAPAQVGGYAFRGIDDVLAALHPQLVEHGVIISVNVASVEQSTLQLGNRDMILATVKVDYGFHLAAVAGQSFFHCVVGQGMDTADKAVAKAMSTAMKTLVFQAFAVPTDEAIDTEADVPPERPAKSPKPKPAPDPKRASGKGITEAMAERLMIANKTRCDGTPLNQRGQMQAALHHLGLAQIPEDAKSWKDVQTYLADTVPSSRDNPGVYDALYDTLREGVPADPEGGEEVENF